NKNPSDVSVKLEVLTKTKCPRFHQDKVPVRLICTYVGPCTEWLNGYDSHHMVNNRSPPQICNKEISRGRPSLQATPGDVLLLRGHEQSWSIGELSTIHNEHRIPGVAHRSPDLEEGQRRLVLTMDIGDTCGLSM
ncbi:unnamed protein product, partial [Choristocarpus tenellus]